MSFVGYCVVKDGCVDIVCCKYLCVGLEVLLCGGDDVIGYVCKVGVVGLGCFGNFVVCFMLKVCVYGIGYLCVLMFDDGKCIGVGVCIWYSWVVGNGVWIVVCYVGDD